MNGEKPNISSMFDATTEDFSSFAHPGCPPKAKAELYRKIERTLAELATLRKDIAEVEWGSIRSLVNGTSLPMDMQPARQRWLAHLDRMQGWTGER